MVRLRRGPPPRLLQEQGAEWTERWRTMREKRRAGDWAPGPAKKVLSDELRKLAFGKCAFCESLLDVASYLEIEHYVAKALHPEHAFNWNNLFPICSRCNSAKGSADHAGTLIKPDDEDPERMLWLHPDTGKLEPRSDLEPVDRLRVERTLGLCDLQRGPLCTKRIQTMEFTIRWLERLSHLEGGFDRLLREEWDRLIDPRTEYKFVIRHVFETRRQPRLAEWDRAKFRIEE
jgi:uncharacterized protein (TIGR02646 family)